MTRFNACTYKMIKQLMLRQYNQSRHHVTKSRHNLQMKPLLGTPNPTKNQLNFVKDQLSFKISNETPCNQKESQEVAQTN